MPRDEKRSEPDPAAAADTPTARGRGRPARWSSPEERRRVHQERRRDRERQVRALLLAIRDAWWEEPELQRIIHDGDDLAVLQALTGYYRRRHWRHGRPTAPVAAHAPAIQEGGA